jgi:hypothetical protein
MKRRDFLRIGVGTPLVGSTARTAVAAEQHNIPNASGGLRQDSTRLSEVDAFNYVIGTQTIGAAYQFTEESLLLETARAILDMGSNILKFSMGRDYRRQVMKPTRTDIGTLTELARLEPSYRQVLEMPFAYYLIWTYAFTSGSWYRGLSPENQEKEYQELRQFVSHLLRTYSGTGKTFLLGHWEGDWHLRHSLKADLDKEVTAESIQGMVDWLNVRQKAVDDAKRETPHHDVQLWHYTEVNLVTKVAMAGRPSVTNSVLPKTNVDYVSYSSYDSLGDIANQLPKALDYIEGKLPPKPEVGGKRVFIGEYGFPARRVPEEERDRRSRQVMRIGVEWGCPFVLCWEMYNNDVKDGQQNGFWLIDDKGAKQPLWHTHHDFYQMSHRFVTDFRQKEGRLPTAEEFRRFAIRILDEDRSQAG